MAILARSAVPRIYALADLGVLGESGFVDAVVTMAEAGLRWIQIRAKKSSDAGLCLALESICRRIDLDATKIWINDRVDLALMFPVAGVHLGQQDLPPASARRLAGDSLWIGQSTHSEDQLVRAVSDEQVDVVAVGPVFDTVNKERPDPVVGCELVRTARALTGKPVVAIGGLTPANLSAPLAAGADAVAVLGAVCRGDVASNARALLRAAEAV